MWILNGSVMELPFGILELACVFKKPNLQNTRVFGFRKGYYQQPWIP